MRLHVFAGNSQRSIRPQSLRRPIFLSLALAVLGSGGGNSSLRGAVADGHATLVAPQVQGSNPIVAENQQPGSSAWIWTRPGDDATGQIKGYASAAAVDQNQTVTLHVSVNPAQTFSIDFFRIGWYGGAGARHRLHVGPLNGSQQTPCVPDPNTGLIACNWAPSYSLTVPADWTSGIYVALLTNAQGYQNYLTFVVGDNRPAPLLYQRSIATDQAYNNYPNDGQTGKSLYAFSSYGAATVSGSPAAVKVSFDRPMADSGLGLLMNWEINLIRWLERSGYDVTYSTSIETHSDGLSLRQHRGFLSSGHDEYWTKEMFDNVEAARDAGVNLAFFGANNVFTQVRFEPSSAGVPNRVMVCYRNMAWNPIDPVQGPTTTTEFRNPPVNRPEQSLIGIQTALILPNVDYVVTNSSHWVYAGTGFRDGDSVAGIVGYEADAFVPSYPPPNSSNQTLLSRSPYTDPRTGILYYSNSSIYQAPSGAWVFAAGTMSWSWALDDVPGPNSHFRVDARIQQTTANILDAFINGAPSTTNPLITGLSPRSGREGTTVTISGTNFTGVTAVHFNGVPATFTAISNTTIDAVVPANAPTGPVSVTTATGTATSRDEFIVVRPPTIARFTPTSARAGSLVSIVGASFTGTTAVRFNGVSALFAVVSDSAVQTIVPSAAATGPLTVVTPEGTATSSTNFIVLGAPTITGFTPSQGPAGTSVTISGSSFTGASAVTFNGTAATFAVASDTTIQATVPPGATSGPIAVTTPEGSATSSGNFVVSVAPIITSFTPASGPAGTSVTIIGSTFTGATQLTFNQTSASFTVVSDTAIQATVPSGATSGPVQVTTPGGTATSPSNFTVVNPPVVSGFSPASGQVGTNVAISGTNFTGATAVTFNQTVATFTVSSSTTIQATVPTGATSGPVQVTTPGGTATSPSNFTVVNPPVVSGFSPASGQVGTNVTISGANFTGATAVTFNGTAATFTVSSPTTIDTTVPAGAASGPIRVTTSVGTATSPSNFTVVNPPVISGFSPASGQVGTTVTVNGANFIGASRVTFNGVSASFSVTSATAIQASVPGGATSGPLSVTTAAGTTTSAGAFVVLYPPSITGFTPSGGVAGSTVTISGANLTGATTVTFNGVAAAFSVISATSIRATVPTTATTGPIRVTTPDGTASSASAFVMRFTLTVSKSGLLGGTVTSSPAGINCGTSCSANFDGDTVVTLTATPALLSLFTSWSGCDSVSGNTCQVTMNRARAVTARFLP